MNMRTDKFDAILYVIPDENDVFEADSRLMTMTLIIFSPIV